MPTHTRATLCGLAAILLWSLLAVMTVWTGAIPPFQLLATAFGISGIAGLALLHRRGGVGDGLRQPAWAALLTTAALFGSHALYFLALKTAPPVEANLINYLWPLLVVVLAGLVGGERVLVRQVLGTLLGLGGAVLVVTRGTSIDIDPAHAPGYLAAFGAALAWATYSVLNRRHAQVPSGSIVGPYLVTAVLGGVAHLAFETTVVPTGPQWAVLLAMGLGPVGAAYWLWDTGSKRGDLVLLGSLSYTAPLLSTAWLLVAGLAEPHWTHAAAVALLLLGATLALRRKL